MGVAETGWYECMDVDNRTGPIIVSNVEIGSEEYAITKHTADNVPNVIWYTCTQICTDFKLLTDRKITIFYTK